MCTEMTTIVLLSLFFYIYFYACFYDYSVEHYALALYKSLYRIFGAMFPPSEYSHIGTRARERTVNTQAFAIFSIYGRF